MKIIFGIMWIVCCLVFELILLLLKAYEWYWQPVVIILSGFLASSFIGSLHEEPADEPEDIGPML